jgi:small subunit ribosomal protein S2
MNETNNTKEVETLFNLGAHLGHKKNRLHPKAKKHLYSMVDGVSIIDLTQTVELLKKARAVLEQAGKDEKRILIVATKKVASQFASEICKEYGVPYMTTKWLPGMLTNFNSLVKNVRKYEQMKQEQGSGAWEQFVKHERMKLAKELTRLEKLYGGLETLTQKPDVLVVIDIKKEKNAIKEAKSNNIPVVALVDTNSNPEEVDYPVIANDDAPAVVEYIIREFVKAYSPNGAVTKAPAKKEVKVAQEEQKPAVTEEKKEKTVKQEKPTKEIKTEKKEQKKATEKSKPAAKTKSTAKPAKKK